MKAKYGIAAAVFVGAFAVVCGTFAAPGTSSLADAAIPRIDIAWPPSAANVQGMGLHFATATQAVAITADQAVQIAIDTRVGSAVASQASGVATHLVLFSDDNYPGTDVSQHGRCTVVTDADGKRHCSLAKTLAWVVTFEGVNYPLPGDDGAGPEYAHEVHVVVDAQTGEDLELFSYQ